MQGKNIEKILREPIPDSIVGIVPIPIFHYANAMMVGQVQEINKDKVIYCQPCTCSLFPIKANVPLTEPMNIKINCQPSGHMEIITH
jgi:hypothetical protein